MSVGRYFFDAPLKGSSDLVELNDEGMSLLFGMAYCAPGRWTHSCGRALQLSSCARP